ncbi:MAG: phenylalanine--tRNA ligase subunit alpha, partial [Candidatus Syntrophosphaera sp.]
MQNQLREAAEQAKRDIAACSSKNDILNVRARYLGKKSLINSLYSKLRELPDEEKPAFGQQINNLRQEVEKLLA